MFSIDNNDTYFTRAGKTLLRQSLEKIISVIPKDGSVKSMAVAGGCFRSYFFKEKYTDLDIFLLSDRNTAREFITKTRYNLVKEYPKIDFGGIAEVTLKLPVNFSGTIGTKRIEKKFLRFNIPPLPNRNTFPLQLIQYSHNVDGEEIWPECGRELISLFDIIPTCFAAEVVYNNDTTYVFNGVSAHPLLLESLVNKELLPNTQYGRVINPVMALERFYKYTSVYGFKVSSKEHMTLFCNLMGIPDSMQISYNIEGDSIACEESMF